mgnify:CR=1 FL=1
MIFLAVLEVNLLGTFFPDELFFVAIFLGMNFFKIAVFKLTTNNIKFIRQNWFRKVHF